MQNIMFTLDDAEVEHELQRIDPEEFEIFCRTAMRIGVMALRVARGEIDTQAMQAKLDAALNALSTLLINQADQMAGRLGYELDKHFKPGDGSLDMQLDKFKSDASYIINQMTEISAERIEAIMNLNLGQNSALMKLINPEYSSAIVHAIEETNKGLVAALTQNVQENVIGQFSIDEPNTALARLKNIVQTSQAQIVDAFNLNNPQSALARINRELGERLTVMTTSNVEFREEVRGILARLEARKEERAASTSHGIIYEDSVGMNLGQLVRAGGHIFEVTGSTTGLIRNCKVGDFIIEFSSDHIAAGARVVVEAKSAGGYSMQKMLDESKIARDNRAAQFSLFVIDPQYAPPDMDSIVRQGDALIVQFNPEQGDTMLKAAYSIAMSLSVRKTNEKNKSPVNVYNLERAALEVQKRAESLEDVQTWTETIAKSSEKILDRIRIARKNLNTQAETLLEEIQALKE